MSRILIGYSTSTYRLKQMEKSILRMNKEAQTIVEQAARYLMQRIPKLNQVCMAMGYVTFYDKDGHSFDEEGNRGLIGVELTKKELVAVTHFMRKYVQPYEEMFGPCWSPVKWTGPNGKRITQW